MDNHLFSPEHVQLIGLIVLPLLGTLGSGIGWLIWKSAQNQLKIDYMWDAMTNHLSELTGYKPGDEKKHGGRK